MCLHIYIRRLFSLLPLGQTTVFSPKMTKRKGLTPLTGFTFYGLRYGVACTVFRMRGLSCLLLLVLVLLPQSAAAQYMWQETERTPSKPALTGDMEYHVETQVSVSKGKTPLWLNANKYGLSSLSATNGYVRGSVMRPLSADSARRWGIGYGLDVAVPLHYTSQVVVQQAFAEVRWLHGVLSVGAMQQPMELKNQTLSSGPQTLGINARPVPQVRLALPEYWTVPLTRGWLHLKGHIAYGRMTDDGWQHDFTDRKKLYADHVLYHSKAGYLRIGHEYRPLSLEMGLEMVSFFGGEPWTLRSDGTMERVPTKKGLKSYWYAFLPGGSDATDGSYRNSEGDLVGSWLLRLSYDADLWRFSLYGDHFFEDHSQMFFLDYNGYGSGEEWQQRKRNRYYVYALKDMMLGAELNLKYGTWLRNVVFEYIYTKYQSGPYNHDHTKNLPDHMAGMDDYYNHSVYTGFQHWGQVIGNPLYRSPLYNTDANIRVRDNRFVAFHLGVDGRPTGRLSYRLLGTWQKGWGTYDLPFNKAHHNISFLAEAAYVLPKRWTVKAAYAMDFGSSEMLGHNAGMQLTIGKTFRGKRAKR